MKRSRVVVLLLLVAGACRRPATDSASLVAQRFQEDVPKVEAALGVSFKTPPRFEIKSRDQVRAFVAQQLTDSVAKSDLAGEEAAFKALGLVPDSVSLEKLVQSVLDEQIAGYYDPKTKVLYVVDGATPEILGITVTHELVHALQDQYINLDSLQRLRGNDDAQLALQAVIEGQATFEQMRIMLGDQVQDMLPEVWQKTREAIRGEHASMPVFDAAPLAIQELLLFPYLSGAQFIHDIEKQRPATALFTSLPASTEQILHPNAYLATPPDEPTRVTLPAPSQGRVIYDNTVGEFVTRLFMFQHLQQQGPAVDMATGWDGDRLLLVETPKGRGVIWASVWDTAIDAAEYARAMERTVDVRYAPVPPRVIDRPLEGSEYSVKGRSISVTSGNLRGHPFALYVDMPEGINATSVVDLNRIRLEP